jgi:hypothetical protein
VRETNETKSDAKFAKKEDSFRRSRALHAFFTYCVGHGRWDSDTAEEFFANSAVAMTCIDSRTPAAAPTKSRWKIYGPLFQRLRESAVRAQAKDRTKKLLGRESVNQH